MVHEIVIQERWCKQAHFRIDCSSRERAEKIAMEMVLRGEVNWQEQYQPLEVLGVPPPFC